MKQVIFTVGISASGKSTWALDQVKNHRNTVRVERDIIRQRILKNKGVEWNWDNWKMKWEKNVNPLWRDDIMVWLSTEGIDTIIVSDTNLNKHRLKEAIKWIQDLGHEAIIKFFPIKFEEALKRDAARPHGVGPTVLGRQWEQWCLMTKKQHIHEEGKPKAIIVDIDGTLAINNNGRSPFQYSRVYEDDVNELLATFVRGVYSREGIHVIFLSGREGTTQCLEDTARWLHRKARVEGQLYMREEGNHESDDTLKERLFRDNIEPFYNVIGAFDDRPRIVRMWRSIGIETYALGNQAIDF